MLERRLAGLRSPWTSGHVALVLDRKDFLASALAALPEDSSKWRQPWRFSFKGEPAVDAAGVAREFWSMLSDQLFGRSAGLFMYAATDQLTYQVTAVWLLLAARLLR
jgi:hypothetical protein